MASDEKFLTIPYPDDLLLSLKESEDEFAAEARLLLAVKLYEMGRISTGMAARLAGMERVAFMFALGRFGLSPIGVDADEVESDAANAWAMVALERVVVTNTTPIISLSLIGRLSLLKELYGEVLLPPAVRGEVLAGGVGRAGATELRGADWLHEVALQDPARADLLADLDRGEAEAIALAQELEADLLLVERVLELAGEGVWWGKVAKMANVAKGVTFLAAVWWGFTAKDAKRQGASTKNAKSTKGAAAKGAKGWACWSCCSCWSCFVLFARGGLGVGVFVMVFVVFFVWFL